MWHYVTTLVAAAFFAMAACDSSAGPGDEPDPTITTDTRSADNGKVDDPAPVDTNMADTSTPDTGTEPDTTALPPPEQICPTLVPLQGTWHKQSQYHQALTLTVSSQSNELCMVNIERVTSPERKVTQFFEGVALPITTETSDSTVVGGIITATLFTEDSLLKIRISYGEYTDTFCYER